jgi:hypothetical protein
MAFALRCPQCVRNGYAQMRSSSPLTSCVTSLYRGLCAKSLSVIPIRRLKLDGAINGDWSEVFEAVVYKISKYLAQ